MTQRDKVELQSLLDKFIDERDCGFDCHNCEWGRMISENDSSSCPLEDVRDMVFTKFSNQDLWNDLKG